uniref:Retrotransposon protein n=1 Tax=Tanacetum cinerariifolium TaxID=118510 RepID=A0A6L2KR26_TANCI|nr:retrotransposon protein [Tanacetum cinerariifolium]
MKVKESLNVIFDESPPPTKLSPVVDDDVGKEEAIRKNTKIVNTNNEEDESIEVDEIVNIKDKAYVVLNKHTMKVKDSLNVSFDETPPPTKLSPLVDDDVGEEEAIRKNIKIVNTNNEEDESIEVDEIVNIKESKNHPIDQVKRNLNQRTLRGMYLFRVRQDKVLPYGMILTCLLKNLKENMEQWSFDERYELIPRKISSLKVKQTKRPLPKRTRNVGKSKQTQLTTSSSTESLPSDNEDLPSTKLSPRS